MLTESTQLYQGSIKTPQQRFLQSRWDFRKKEIQNDSKFSERYKIKLKDSLN